MSCFSLGADVKVLPNHVGSCVSEMQLVVRLALVVVVCLFVCLYPASPPRSVKGKICVAEQIRMPLPRARVTNNAKSTACPHVWLGSVIDQLIND